MLDLEKIFNIACSKEDYNIPDTIKDYLKIIGEHCYKHKAVYTVLVTLLYYKYLHPEQDVRMHQEKLENGFSGRTFDTNNVTPVLRKLGLPSMSESGWLTRSLEQPYPYTLNYSGRIAGGVKDPFLWSLDYVEKNSDKAEEMLMYLLNTVWNKSLDNIVIIKPLSNPEKLTIDNIIKALDKHFRYRYDTHNGAKLPVLAFYAIYTSIISEVKRYEGCRLAPLASLTACDLTSKASGDVEIFKGSNLFESVEIKLDKKINAQIVRVVKDKIYRNNPSRYYVLSYCGIDENERVEIQNVVDDVRREHGCQIIINGLLPTIKYYLRLITNIEDFVKNYSSFVERDVELQTIHKTVWNEILQEL